MQKAEAESWDTYFVLSEKQQRHQKVGSLPIPTGKSITELVITNVHTGEIYQKMAIKLDHS